MTRYEWIVKGGIDEMAKAIAFQLVIFFEYENHLTLTCDNVKELVSKAEKAVKPWLDEEIKED